MPAALEMALLVLFFGSFLTPLVSPQVASPVTTLKYSTLVSDSTISMEPVMRTSLEYSSNTQVSIPTPSAVFRDNVSFLGTLVGTSTGPGVAELVPFQEDSTKKPSVVLETSNATSDPAIPMAENAQEHSTATGKAVTFDSLETSGGTNESSVTKAARSPETSSGASGLPVTMATNSLETSSGASGLPVTMATNSLETSSGASGLPVTMATNSLETSSGASGLLVTMVPNSPETSSGASGPPVTKVTNSVDTSSGGSGPSGPPATMTTSHLVTSSVASSSPVSSMKVPMVTSPKPSTPTNTEPSGSAGQGRKSMLLVPMLVALLVVTLLVALLLLWRQRQKRRTGVLTLSGGGKRNGVVDAWAGPAQVPDEEAMTPAAGGAGAEKGTGVSESQGSVPRPTLTTFFSRRKSRQGSLAMEELKSGPGASLKGEEEPLVDSRDEAVEGAASGDPGAGDGAALQCP